MQVKMKVYWVYVKAVGPLLSLFICFLYACQSGSAIGANIWLTKWTNDAKLNRTETNVDMRVGVYAALGITQGKRLRPPAVFKELLKEKGSASYNHNRYRNSESHRECKIYNIKIYIKNTEIVQKDSLKRLSVQGICSLIDVFSFVRRFG